MAVKPSYQSRFPAMRVWPQPTALAPPSTELWTRSEVAGGFGVLTRLPLRGNISAPNREEFMFLVAEPAAVAVIQRHAADQAVGVDDDWPLNDDGAVGEQAPD